ncbi:MAG TPA: zf-HC2 domain-containing protein [Anaeromyxobacteraceae bacterium]|nr:zf-HC2 domain-containing protein [Anaeromyxobacteraceae bacterium]
MSSDPIEANATMDCAELARTLDAYLDRELAPREEAEAVAHLASCPCCRELAEGEGRRRSAIRAGLKAAMGPCSEAGRAPDELRARLRLALSQQKKPLWRRVLAPLPIGALAACAAGFVFVFATQSGRDPLVEESVLKHTRDLPLEISAASLGPDSVARWFDGKLDFNPAPPRFRGPDIRVVGARLSHIQDRPAAYVRYELPTGHLGLFILDDPDRRFGEAGRVVHVGPSSVHLINARGFNVAVWRRNEIVYSLVSDLDEDDLTRLVMTAQGLSTDR